MAKQTRYIKMLRTTRGARWSNEKFLVAALNSRLLAKIFANFSKVLGGPSTFCKFQAVVFLNVNSTHPIWNLYMIMHKINQGAKLSNKIPRWWRDFANFKRNDVGSKGDRTCDLPQIYSLVTEKSNIFWVCHIVQHVLLSKIWYGFNLRCDFRKIYEKQG